MTASIKHRIREEAIAAGFDTIGFTDASLPDEVSKHLTSFLEANRHGDMAWMENRREQRAQPTELWPDAKSVIMLGANYGPDHDPLDSLNNKSSGVISVYAQNKDYHDILKKRLKRVARWLANSEKCDVKVFIDTAPVMEKPLAERAGLGWQGKHTNLVARDFGSWLFLGAIFTTLEIEPNKPSPDSCGTCRNCLNACPTDAFPAPYQLDARRCISYLTIEHKGPIPIELRKAIGNRIYGCDDCLAVCPWNKFASRAREAAFHARSELQAPSLAGLAGLDDPAFRQLFSGSPVKRTGRNRFIRNVLIAIGNSGDRGEASTILGLLNDQSAIVRGAAIWALSQLLPIKEFQKLDAQYSHAETDLSVQAEWAAGLSHEKP